MYDEYKTTTEWDIIQKAINDLIENQDLQLTTTNDHIIGYITKQLIDAKQNDTQH